VSSVDEAPAPLDLGLGGLVELERPRGDVPRSLVGVDRDAGRRDRAVDQLERGGDRAVAEAARAGADDEREDPDAELVDEVVLEQRLDQSRAAVDLDLGPVLAFEPRDGIR
jgi:hypothetical protein